MSRKSTGFVLRQSMVAGLLVLVAGACGGQDPETEGPVVAPSASAATSVSASAAPSAIACGTPASSPTSSRRPPAVVVTEPQPCARVSSPVRIAGNADVFEANVSLRLLDESGAELARTFTTATCGTGCRGDYSIDVPFMVTRAQLGTIEAWWDSPEDGSPQDIVRVPVILQP